MATECIWLTKLVEAYVYGLQQFDVHTNGYFDNASAFTACNAALIDTVLQGHWERFGRPDVLVLKDPLLLALVPELCALVPDATVAVMVRDIRDVVASQVERVRRWTGNPNWYESGAVHNEADKYVSQYSRLVQDQNILSERIVCIRYESLASGVDMAVLEGVLGLPDMDVSRLWKRAFFDIVRFTEHEAFSPLWGQQVSPDDIGQHRFTLDESDAETISDDSDGVEKLFSLYRGIA
jgi:hypothetical protein